MDLAKLVVALELESARYQKELDKARGQLSRFSSQASGIAKNIGQVAGAAALSAATAVAFAVGKAVENADKLNKAAQSAGTSVEFLSQMQYAAALADVSFESLNGALAKLSKNVGEGIAGTKDQADAFKELGISLESSAGIARPTSDIFLDVADKLSKMEDGAKKNMIAQSLFGKSYAELIPLLNSGRDGLKQLTDEADKLGVTMSAKTAQAAEEFNDTLTRMKMAGNGMANQIMVATLPLMQELANAALKFVSDGSNMAVVTGALTGTLKAVAIVAAAAGTAITNLGDRIGATMAAVQLASGGEFKKAFDVLSESNAKARANSEGFLKFAQNAWDPKPIDAYGAATGKMAGAVGGATNQINKIAKATKAHRDVIGDTIKQMEKQVATFGMTAQQVQLYELRMAGAKGATFEYAQELAKTITGMEDYNKKVEEGKTLTESVRTPLEILTAEQGRLNGLLDEGAISQETYNRALLKANEEFANTDPAMQQLKKDFEEVNDILGETSTGKLEDATRKIGLLQEALASGRFGAPGSMESMNTYYEAVAAVMDKTNAKGKESADLLTEAYKSAAQNMQSALADFLFDPFSKGLGGMLSGFAQTLRKMAAEAASAQIMKSLGGMMSGSETGWISALGQAFAGAHANGGLTQPGQWEIVGEKGPEVRMAGNVPTTTFSNSDASRMLGGGRSVTQVYNISTPNADSFRASERQIMRRARMGLSNV